MIEPSSSVIVGFIATLIIIFIFIIFFFIFYIYKLMSIIKILDKKYSDLKPYVALFLLVPIIGNIWWLFLLKKIKNSVEKTIEEFNCVQKSNAGYYSALFSFIFLIINILTIVILLKADFDFQEFIKKQDFFHETLIAAYILLILLFINSLFVHVFELFKLNKILLKINNNKLEKIEE